MGPFTLTALVTGVACYVLGLGFGWMFNRMGNKEKVQQAYKQGEANATEEYNKQKAELSEDLQDRLGQMRDTLVASFEAYEDAVQLLDTKLSPGFVESLSLDNANKEQKQIDYKESKSPLRPTTIKVTQEPAGKEQADIQASSKKKIFEQNDTLEERLIDPTPRKATAINTREEKNAPPMIPVKNTILENGKAKSTKDVKSTEAETTPLPDKPPASMQPVQIPIKKNPAPPIPNSNSEKLTAELLSNKPETKKSVPVKNLH